MSEVLGALMFGAVAYWTIVLTVYLLYSIIVGIARIATRTYLDQRERGEGAARSILYAALAPFIAPFL